MIGRENVRYRQLDDAARKENDLSGFPNFRPSSSEQRSPRTLLLGKSGNLPIQLTARTRRSHALLNVSEAEVNHGGVSHR
jgi:hypothetical protein